MIPGSNLNKINAETSPQKLSQNFTKSQIYTKGFEYTVVTGSGNEFNPTLGGKCRFLYGIGLYSEAPNAFDLDKFSLVINQEVIVDNVLWNAYNPQGASGNIFKPNQFFDLPRILSGSDNVQLTYNSINGHKINIVFYLSEIRPN